jgi:hypothetical protein
MTTSKDQARVPRACTLPAEERPLRTAEFDNLFSTALHDQQRLAPTRLRWRLDPAVEPEVRELAGRETACCSFFTFTFAPAADALQVDVDVPAEQAGVLDALAGRAAARMRR